MKKLFMLALVLGVAACNTVDGVGKDISSAAQAVSG